MGLKRVVIGIHVLCCGCQGDEKQLCSCGLIFRQPPRAFEAPKQFLMYSALVQRCTVTLR